ncbi:AraC family transcriptional regulator [Hymenobacter sp. YC55]|uniref:helix-turn-helix domain-containing protein n=1 Tax=Hymenobacter sp. YC55 TaxID=3034019 RepID=UPI0023F8600F|nr:AraC family transcriptional regulator [Hymenobacter sp. YC55]MDF7814014.1 helix-turn-helix transcriptional regulator [Hymenobacter sp. YC55]
MIHQQKLADYYAHSVLQAPSADWLKGGHFRAWRLEDFLADFELMGVYSRKDFFKITLSTGPSTYHYAHQRLGLAPNEPALVFTNTQIPYAWELPEGATCQGYCCVFTEAFVPTLTLVRPADWPVFRPDQPSFFRLTAAQHADFARLFEQMLAEQDSDYSAKDELLYHYLMTCIHGALKLTPIEELPATSGPERLVAAFHALLARQYPIVTPARRLALRTPADFADHLAVHVNYLNRVLKAATGKPTSQLLAERLVQEARTLLLHTDWPVSRISYCMGFDEPTHFAQMFRKVAGCTPSSLRQV